MTHMSEGCDCPSVHATGDFPGTDAIETGGDFANGMQPAPMACWPTQIGNDTVTVFGCHEEGAVASTEDKSWRGQCEGLESVPATDASQCRLACLDDPECAMWQWVPEGVKTGGGFGCFLGIGYDCKADRGTGWDNVTSEAIQRGEVKVLAKLNTVQVNHLTKIFDEKLYGDESKLAASHCKKSCYATLTCNYWQYYTSTGCWMEYPLGFETNVADKTRVPKIDYPLVLNGEDVGIDKNLDIVDGELIQ